MVGRTGARDWELANFSNSLGQTRPGLRQTVAMGWRRRAEFVMESMEESGEGSTWTSWF